MDDSKKSVLIVGGAGYIGGCLTDLMKSSGGYETTVYDCLLYEERYLKQVNFIYGDVRDKIKLGAIINDFDIVVWLAALVGDEACAINLPLTKEINFSSVEWLVEHYKGKIVFASTCSVYGASNSLLDESTDPNPLSYYAMTKLEAEKLISERAKNHLIFRLGTLFGAGDEYSRLRLDLVVNSLTKKAALGELLVIFGGGQWRPLLHVRDAARAILFAIEHNEINGLFNLSNKNYMICDIAEEIKRIIPGARIEYNNTKFDDLRNYRVSADKFRAYGWQPEYSLEYGIREVLRILKEGRVREPDDPIYLNGVYLKNKIV